MPIGIDPKVDFAFKLVFGSPDHTNITTHFLNAVLQWRDPITAVEILNPIQGKDRSEEKLVVLDVLATDSQGRQFNVEMQTTLPMDLTKRLTYYNCLNYIRQLGEGDGYQQLRPAINICVLNRVLFRESALYHLSFRLRCDQSDVVFCDDLEFHTLELPKFAVSGDRIDQSPPMEKWLYFLQHAEHLEPGELASRLGDPAYLDAVGVLEMISRSPEDRQFYDARQKFIHDEEGRLLAARQEGREEGLEEGLERGLERGLEEGREEGRQEGSLIGKIQLLQQILSEPESPTDSLARRSLQELASLHDDLQRRLRERGI